MLKRRDLKPKRLKDLLRKLERKLIERVWLLRRLID